MECNSHVLFRFFLKRRIHPSNFPLLSSGTVLHAWTLVYNLSARLGHINNYVDYMYFGAPYYHGSSDSSAQEQDGTLGPTTAAAGNDRRSDQPSSSHRWISMIPNSFVIANTFPRWDPASWKLELSVSPSRMFWPIFLVRKSRINVATRGVRRW